IGRIRLWEETIKALGCDDPGLEREMHRFNKYFLPVRPPQDPIGRRRLRRVYQLHTAPNSATQVIRLHGGAAVEVLMQNLYRIGLAECLGYKTHAFTVCAAAARDVAVFRFSRPFGFPALGQGVELLENHLSDIC